MQWAIASHCRQRSIDISKVFKVTCYFFIACVVVTLGGLFFIKQPAIADQLNAWQVLPRPERFSELYFTDYHQLPATLFAGSNQRIRFTVGNFEHQNTTYYYSVIAFAPDKLIEQPLAHGSFTLDQNQSRATTQAIVIPALSSRIMVQVSLQYRGIVPGASQPSIETQSIHYWLTAPNAPKGTK